MVYVCALTDDLDSKTESLVHVHWVVGMVTSTMMTGDMPDHREGLSDWTYDVLWQYRQTLISGIVHLKNKWFFTGFVCMWHVQCEVQSYLVSQRLVIVDTTSVSLLQEKTFGAKLSLLTELHCIYCKIVNLWLLAPLPACSWSPLHAFII